MRGDAADVELVDVRKSFGRVRAVDGVSFTVAPGQFFSLLGPSGCGKSTLLRLIGGFERPDDGQVAIRGTDMTRLPPNRRPTALVFQRWALFPHMTAAQNIAFGLQVRRERRTRISGRVNELLDLVGLAGCGDRRPAQLSGGQQQRVALARALAIRPRVLLLDEPLSSLDLKLRMQMRLELKRLQREVGTTFLYVTHDQGEAMTMSDAIAVIKDGRIEQIGGPEDVYDRPRSAFVATFIGDTNLLDGLTVQDADGPRLRVGELGVVPPGDCLPPGSRCTVSLRYERVQVGRALECANRFRGRVREVIFSGASVRYLVALEASDLTLFCDRPRGTGVSLSSGDPVEVGWDPDAAVLMAR